MTQKLISRIDFATLVGVSPSTVTRAATRALAPAAFGKHIDRAHPVALEFIAKHAQPKAKPPATGVDTRYEEAIACCKKTGRWSASSLQREMAIGYNRARRIMNTMEATKIIPVNPVPDPSAKAATPPPDSPEFELDPLLAAAAAAEQREHLHEMPEDIARYADMTLRELILRFGTVAAFRAWLQATKSIEDIHEKRLKNAQTDGTLIARRLVKVGIIDVFNSAHLRVMTDGAKTIAAGAISKHEGGASLPEVEQHISDVLGSFFKPVKDKAVRVLRNA